ncbi:MAG: cache domain-containing protein [Fibrobacterales bacterium]
MKFIKKVALLALVSVSMLSAGDKEDLQLIMKKVDQAVALVEKKGTAAFKEFKKEKGEFRFIGTYIWIHDLSGIMLMHPIKTKLEGKNIIGLKDGNGKRFFVEMNSKIKADGEGWVHYTWPKPGEKKRSDKVSYVKKAMLKGKVVVIGSGIYDHTLESVTKLLK